MSNYSKTTDFEAKDSLPTGDSGKIIRGAEFETEFDAISTAIATKADTAGPTFTGTLTFETISDGTIGVTAFVDEDNMASDSATLVPTQQSVKAYVDSQVTAQDLDFQADSGGALSIDLDSEALTLTGGTGIDTSGALNEVTFAIDSTVATLTGTQTLTNKTLTSPDVNTPDIDGGTIDGTVIGGTTPAAISATTVSATGNITVGGTVDGRDVAADGTKLDGIESGATADQTDAEIRAAVEAATDSNVFTDADHTKLNAIEANATADQTAAEIRTLVEAATDSNVFTDADHTKLNGIEASADVTDTTNVTAAGALMDSELTNLTAVKALDQGVATTDSPAFAGLTTTADVSFGDNDKAIFGAGSDLQIYHDGTNSYISDQGTGHLKLLVRDFRINNDSDTKQIMKTVVDGQVELYHNNSKKFETTSTGIDVTGVITTDGMTSDGVATVKVASAGATAEAFNVYNTGSGNNTQSRFYLGASEYNTAGRGLRIDAGRDSGADGVATFYSVDQAEHSDYEAIKILTDGGVTLSHLGSNKLATTSTGIDVTGTVTADKASITTVADFGLELDTSTAGDGILKIGHFSNGTFIGTYNDDGGVGDVLRLGTHSGETRLRIDSGGDISFYEDTGTTAKLFWDASAESLGIGTSSPVTLLNTKGATLTATTDKREILIEAHGDGVNNSQGALTGITFRNSPTTYTAGSFNRTSGVYGLNEDSAGYGRSMGLAFYTATNDATAAERMRIDSSGNVGIGTSSPSSKLEVNGYGKFTSSDNAPRLHLIGGRDYMLTTTASGIFGVFDNTGSSYRMVIDASGNVGIGTSSPNIANFTKALTILDSSASNQIPAIELAFGSNTRGANIAVDNRASVKALAITAVASDLAMTFGTNNTERMRIDSSGLVAIGTSSPVSTAQLTVGGTSRIAPVSGNGLLLASGGSDRMFISTAGNVGIGTSSPDAILETSASATGNTIGALITNTNQSGTADSVSLNFGLGRTADSFIRSVEAIKVLKEQQWTGTASTVDCALVFSTTSNETTAERMRIDSSGNVTVKASGADQARTLSLQGTNGASEAYQFNLIADGANAAAKFMVGVGGGSATERMRIDASGNLLVGKTSASKDTVGAELKADGRINATMSSGSPLLANRKTSDGDIATFQKDGSTVGSIGNDSTALTIGSGSTGVKFGTAAVWATTGGSTNANGTKDLGASTVKWKDLYLSGSVIADGSILSTTGSAAAAAIRPNNDINCGIFFPAANTFAVTTDGSEAYRVDSFGNLLVGTTSSHGKLAIGDFSATGADYGVAFVDGSDVYFVRSSTTIPTSSAHYQFYNTNGNVGSITTNGSATAYNTSSDQRLKDNIVDAPSASDDIDAIQVRSFDWKADGSHQKYGMVAQELQTVAPEAVSAPEDPDEMMGVDYSKLVPMLVKEIQSLRARVAQLEGAN